MFAGNQQTPHIQMPSTLHRTIHYHLHPLGQGCPVSQILCREDIPQYWERNYLSLDNSSPNTEVYPRGTEFDLQGNPILEGEDDSGSYGEELKAFGYEVFANSPQTFAPLMDIAIPADYIIGQ